MTLYITLVAFPIANVARLITGLMADLQEYGAYTIGPLRRSDPRSRWWS